MGIDARMFFRVPYEPTDDQVRDWSYHLCSAVGADKFWLDLDGKYGDEPRSALTKTRKVWGIETAPGEWFVKVHLSGRYYGPGYERGDLQAYCAIAEWAEQNVPEAAVWYGGDSSGVLARPFDAARRAELKRHLYTPDAGRAYYNEWPQSSFASEDAAMAAKMPPCGFCSPDHRPQRYSWGPGTSGGSFYCRGCGRYFSTEDGGASWTVGRERS